ncbi:MAG TPA: ABC transporter ATP-binding protein [Gaiellaceae bacterium]
MSNNGTPMLDVSGLTVAYDGIRAVRDLDLSVAKGEVVALLGPNGAGKSSTLNAIVGLAPTVAGTVRIDGVPVTGKPPEEIVRLGCTQVPEGRQVFGELTVAENLTLGGLARSSGRSDREVRDDLLELFPILRDRSKQTAGTLSGGEQQQLAIARALMSDPRIVLFDEPSLGLAPVVTERIFNLIASLRSRGLTMLIVEQNVELALNICDRSYVLASGDLMLTGTPAELRAATGVQRTYLGLGGD